MFGKFLKGRNRLSDPDPTIRREAVQALAADKADNLQAELAELLQQDPDPAVRRACVDKLTDPELLGTLLTDDVLADAAAARLGVLIDAGASCSVSNHPLVLRERLLIAGSDETEKLVLDEIATEISDPELLQDLVLRCRQELRQPILELPPLQSADALTQLERRTRDHDKSLNRYARERIEQIKQLRQRGSAAQRRASELASALTKHRKTAHNATYFQRQHILNQEFSATVQTFEDCEAQLAKHGIALEPISAYKTVFASLDEEPEKQPAPPAPAAVPHRADTFPELVKAFEALHDKLAQGGDYAELSQSRQTLTDAWLSAADHKPPESAQHAVFQAVSHAFRELADAVDRLGQANPLGSDIEPFPEVLPTDPDALQTLWQTAGERRALIRQAERVCKQINWPEWAKPNAQYGELLLKINSMEQDLHRIAAHEHELIANLETLVGNLAEQIDAGSVQSASATLGKARKISKGLPGKNVRNLVKNLNHQAARIAELRDWQTFATTPKREELCEAMQALVDAPFSPPDQAQRIKHLRKDWNDLGVVSKAQDRRLAERFNHLAEQAFEPCRSYFGEQAERRRENLQHREEICNQLESYLTSTDWATADMKAAEQIMRTARSEWRKYHPVDRTPGKPLEKRFEKLQDRLHDQVKGEWGNNLNAKQAIVDEAKALSEGDAEMGEKVGRAKELQHRWRAIGITPRRIDQNLWRQFRASCDQIFTTRDNEKQQADEALETSLEEIEALCDEFAHLLDTTAPLQAEESSLRDFQHHFRPLYDNMPHYSRKSFERRFDDLVRDYHTLLRQKAFEVQFEHLAQLKSWDEAYSAREAAHRAGDTVEFEAPHPAFALREESKNDDAPMERLRMLTISAELAAGLESPDEERELRLQVQVEALKRGLGQRREGDDPMEMVHQWCALGPKLEGIESLRERFFKAVKLQLQS